MWEKIKGFPKYLVKDVIIPNVIWNKLLGILALLASLLGGGRFIACWKATLDGKSISTFDRVFIGVCALICILDLIFLVIYFTYGNYLRRQLKNAPNTVPAFPPLESSYSILHTEFELYFKDREHIVHRQSITYKVTSDRLDSIRHNMQWTGDGYHGSKLIPESQNKGYKLEEVKTSPTQIEIRIVFPEEQPKDHTDTYSFETEVTDFHHYMQPHLNRLIKCHTDRLSLKVTVPEGMIQSCQYYISADLTSDFILSGKKRVNYERVGNFYCYRHVFENLELLRYYRLEWEFAKTAPPPTETPDHSPAENQQ